MSYISKKSQGSPRQSALGVSFLCALAVTLSMLPGLALAQKTSQRKTNATTRKPAALAPLQIGWMAIEIVRTGDTSAPRGKSGQVKYFIANKTTEGGMLIFRVGVWPNVTNRDYPGIVKIVDSSVYTLVVSPKIGEAAWRAWNQVQVKETVEATSRVDFVKIVEGVNHVPVSKNGYPVNTNDSRTYDVVPFPYYYHQWTFNASSAPKVLQTLAQVKEIERQATIQQARDQVLVFAQKGQTEEFRTAARLLMNNAADRRRVAEGLRLFTATCGSYDEQLERESVRIEKSIDEIAEANRKSTSRGDTGPESHESLEQYAARRQRELDAFREQLKSAADKDREAMRLRQRTWDIDKERERVLSVHRDVMSDLLPSVLAEWQSKPGQPTTGSIDALEFALQSGFYALADNLLSILGANRAKSYRSSQKRTISEMVESSPRPRSSVERKRREALLQRLATYKQ